MGIQGLLKAVRPYTEAVHVKKYSGKRVGIDIYSWLHKGAYACSLEICEKRFSLHPNLIPPYVQYCMHRINMLRFNNIVPVVVFDGGDLPSKSFTQNERQRRRNFNLEGARLKLSEGDLTAANELYQRAVEITPLMAFELIKVLKAENIEFVVAPYEADAQLALLSNLEPEQGGVAAVISEDSDLLAYGCNVVVYKMDHYGHGEEITLGSILKGEATPGSDLSFRCFSQDLFTGMCVLAGCDFLPSIPGIGIKRAHALVSKYRNLRRVLSKLTCDTRINVPEGYMHLFKQANAIFHHARVYDANARKVSFLKPLPQDFAEQFHGDIEFLGPDLPRSRVIAIAEGRLDPVTMRAFDEFCTMKSEAPNCLSEYEQKIMKGHERAATLDSRDPEKITFSTSTRRDWLKPAAKIQEEKMCYGIGEDLVLSLAFHDLEDNTKVSASEVSRSSFILPGENKPGAPIQAVLQVDKGFVTHLQLLSAKQRDYGLKNDGTSSQDQLRRHTTSSLDILKGHSSNVVEPAGQKRVFSSISNNNLFKKKEGCITYPSSGDHAFEECVQTKKMNRSNTVGLRSSAESFSLRDIVHYSPCTSCITMQEEVGEVLPVTERVDREQNSGQLPVETKGLVETKVPEPAEVNRTKASNPVDGKKLRHKSKPPPQSSIGCSSSEAGLLKFFKRTVRPHS